MGQAFRRATGRIRAQGSADSTSSFNPKPAVDKRPPVPPAAEVKISNPGDFGAQQSDDIPTVKAENILEDRDPQYDAMLNQMVGRIKTKPGGKLEMGEAFVAERYSRPLPKVRTTDPDSGRYADRPAPPGTLNVAQLRHIILLYQGKADDHNGPMDVHQIAERFQVDITRVQKIVQFLSLPPEDETKQEKK